MTIIRGMLLRENQSILEEVLETSRDEHGNFRQIMKEPSNETQSLGDEFETEALDSVQENGLLKCTGCNKEYRAAHGARQHFKNVHTSNLRPLPRGRKKDRNGIRNSVSALGNGTGHTKICRQGDWRLSSLCSLGNNLPLYQISKLI
ncbi:hypothetical protein BDC45DRAFT_538064 [Circinella umbellata]|nr:hypothetical protein BDC45DRAFT_538064 [Circinella umbellata]